MLRNKIPLHRFIGIAMIGSSILPLAIVLMIIEQNPNVFNDLEDMIGLGLVLLIGGGFLLTGIAYLTGLRWARFVTNIILVIGFAVAAFPVYFFLTESLFDGYWKDTLKQAGILICVLATLFGVFLFVNNADVIRERTEKIN